MGELKGPTTEERNFMPQPTRRRNLVVPRDHDGYPGTVILFFVCTLLALLGFTRSYYHNVATGLATPVLTALLDWLACFYPWLLLAPVVFRLEKSFPLEVGQLRKTIPVLALGGLVAALLAIAVRIGLVSLVRLFGRGFVPAAQSLSAGVFAEYGAQVFLYFLAVVSAYVIRNVIQKNQEQRARDQLTLEKLELESSLRRAELETLRARLNPHFLFNTLQNVSVLAEHDPPTASEMLARLGDLLRAAIRSESQSEMTLEAELSLTQSYLKVEKVRFGNRLSITINVAPGTEVALVPALLLQPLVENAIMHGLRAVPSGTIRIASVIADGRLLLTVSDDGAGLPVASLEHLELGIGLSSTRERLKRLYPGAHEFEIRTLPNGGTEVCIAIPLRFAEAPGEATEHEQSAFADRR